MKIQPLADFSFVPHLRPGDRIFAGQATAEPRGLLRRLLEEARAGLLPQVHLFVGPIYSDTFAQGLPESIQLESYGAMGRLSPLARAGRISVFPGHLSALGREIEAGRFRADVALLQLRPARAEPGWNLGLARDLIFQAAGQARCILGEHQPMMPACLGGEFPADLPLAALAQAEAGPVELPVPPPDATERAIAARIAGLVPDGAVLQLGIGTIPNSICAALSGHRDLGLHSGVVGDGLVDLVESGALTNARKERDRGVSIAGIAMGTRRLSAHVDGNPAFRLAGPEVTHDLATIASLSRVHAINSALEVDLTGQIGAEAVGGRYLGGVGGLVDFQRAAQASAGGRAIIALPAVTAGGESRVVARVGTVTCARSDADIFVTEHGVADLRGQPFEARARRMIAIAAPQHREALDRAWHAMRGLG